MKLIKLTEDLKDALAAAEEAIEGMADGGTCNFDRPYLVKNDLFPKEDGAVVAAIEASGFLTYWSFNSFTRGYHLSRIPGGQGSTRTKAAETIRDVLNERGWECGVHYQMD